MGSWLTATTVVPLFDRYANGDWAATYHRRMELGAWIEAYGRAWESGDEA